MKLLSNLFNGKQDAWAQSQKLQRLLERKNPPVKKIVALSNAGVKNSMGQTAIILAAQHGKADVVKALAAAGADLNATDQGGHSPLTWAVALGHTDVVKVLVEAKGIDLDAGRTAQGHTATEAAKFHKYDQIDALLTAAKAKQAVPAPAPEVKLAAPGA